MLDQYVVLDRELTSQELAYLEDENNINKNVNRMCGHTRSKKIRNEDI